MRSSKADGFSLTELLVSISILGLLAAGSWVTLTRSQYKDELYNATRVMASDFRTVQANALNSTNIKFCPSGATIDAVCELDIVNCSAPVACTSQTPAVIGIEMAEDKVFYHYYARNDVSDGNLRGIYPRDRAFTRYFVNSGAPNVKILSFATVPVAAAVDPISIGFQRQNGNMRINVCPSCTAATELTITLVHAVTGDTATVKLNAVTGRISTQL